MAMTCQGLVHTRPFFCGMCQPTHMLAKSTHSTALVSTCHSLQIFGKGKKYYFSLKALNEMPPVCAAYACIVWPSFFTCFFFLPPDCLSVCLSDWSLESCFSAPWVMGIWETNGCRTDCLCYGQRNAAGVNRTISLFPFWALFSSVLQNFLSKCFRLVTILVIPFT